MARLNKLDCEYTLEEAKNVDVKDYKSNTNHVKPLTESLVGKKPATAAKLFAEAMEARLDEISKKTLGNYVSRAGRHNEKIAVRYKELENMEDKLNHVNHRISPEVHGETGSWKQDSELLSGAIRSIRDKKASLNDKLRKRSEGIYKAVKKLTKEDLDEVEAPANFWNAGMAKMNPIQVSQKQPAEPGQFKATGQKSPKRLADQDSSLEGAPQAVRKATCDDAASRGPKEIELTGDWQADVPDHDFDPKLDSETEFYPLFSQFKAMGAYPSGPARAWESEEIDESEGFDTSYMDHPIFRRNFNSHIDKAKDHNNAEHHFVTTNNGTDHHVRIQHSNDGKSYSAQVYSDAHGQRRSGWDVGKTSHEAFDKAHKAYKENYKMPEYMKEDELNELSKKTLSKYVDVAADKLAGHAYLAGGGSGLDKEGKTKEFRKAVNRLKGIKLANKKLSEDSASLMATATKDEKKAAEQDKKKSSEFKKLHDKHETEVKAKMKELGEEALDEISKKTLASYLKKAKPQKRGLSVKIDNDFKKMQHATDWSPDSEAMKAAKRTNSISHKYHTRNAGIQKATKKLSENALEEGLFDPTKQPLLGLWDEHARRADAHGSGSRNEILKRIEDHVANKHGQEGLKKMKLHTDLTNALKRSTSNDKGHLQALLGNMRTKCAMEG